MGIMVTEESDDGCHSYLSVMVVPILATPCTSSGVNVMSGLPKGGTTLEVSQHVIRGLSAKGGHSSSVHYLLNTILLPLFSVCLTFQSFINNF